ncbi:protease modulator HflC [Candidatus Omnitrophota bacterium]
MKILGPAFVIIFLIVAIVALNSLYIISETEQVVLTQFGEPIGEPLNEPGLYFKIPFIQQANVYEDRILEWDGDANRIPTKDKKYIWVDTTARWKIVDPLRFLQTVYNVDGAQQRLDAILDGAVRNVIADRNLIEIVRSSNRILEIKLDVDVTNTSSQGLIRIPEDSGRDAIRLEILERVKPKLTKFGIEIIDLMIKRNNYDQDVRRKVFERMRSERKRAAEKFRSEGESERARIMGMMEKEMNRIESEAYKKAQIVRGAADAEATKIYADAFSKDPEFYSFLMTLDSYEATMKNDTTLILATDNDYFSYIKSIEGGKRN